MRSAFPAITLYAVICSFVAFHKSDNKNFRINSEAHVVYAHPAWGLQSNIYEVNLRQYDKHNTFKGFQNELRRLRDMGVEILWFMPINPISVKDRKGKLGSYYAVQNYSAVNPEYGTIDDWKALVKKCHETGFKVILDWVPNHSGADNYWLTTHPDFYVRDSAGNAISPYDWSDTRKLNYNNREFRDTMIATMKFWIENTGIDGFRCDVAGDVPLDFWKECITQLRQIKPVFMLAEADKAILHTVGFDATYPWSVESILYGIYSGRTTLAQLQTTLDSLEKVLPPDAMRMYFTTNHDENSWNGTEFERFGEGFKAFAVWTQTMKRSIPLIYSGQEEPNKKRVKFFESDPIEFGKYQLAGFYRTLLHLRKSNSALAADAAFKKLNLGDPLSIYAFTRQKNRHKIAVILNFSKKRQTFLINDPSLSGEPENVFAGRKEKLNIGKKLQLEPWGYLIYNYN